MERYTNLIQDNVGNTLSGVTVSVYNHGTAVLASIYSDTVFTSKANPFTNDTDGTLEFYAAICSRRC